MILKDRLDAPAKNEYMRDKVITTTNKFPCLSGQIRAWKFKAQFTKCFL